MAQSTLNSHIEHHNQETSIINKCVFGCIFIWHQKSDTVTQSWVNLSPGLKRYTETQNQLRSKSIILGAFDSETQGRS